MPAAALPLGDIAVPGSADGADLTEQVAVPQATTPAFDQAMEPVGAERLYLSVVAVLRGAGLTVATGAFRAHMLVESVNDGPINILIDSARTF